MYYKEGIYVGYRYFNTFDVTPSYPFGYGLSYTDFAFRDLTLSAKDFQETMDVSVMVTNTGKVAGKTVVQLYLSAPAVRVDKPSEELKAFAKTKTLAPDESQTLTFTLKAADLASFVPEQSAWVAEKGDYAIKMGTSSADTRLTGSFTLTEDIITETVHPDFQLDVKMDDVLSNH